ncbi:hypothetical protein MMC11_009099 [Xylographa trunciseda]|nr:hypothetical protein [Xylographa trunciseda]
MLSKSLNVWALALLLALGTQATPTGYADHVERSFLGDIGKVVHDGGTRYQATESHPDPISKADLNSKVEGFHNGVQQAHTAGGSNSKWAPNMSSGQHHGDTIHYSSTERVQPGHQGAGPSPKYQQTAAHLDCAHRTGGKCSEGGTTGMVTDKHGADVSMHGDKISSFGKAKLPGQTSGPPVTGHHEGCQGGAGTHGCTDVIAHHGLDDVNKPGRAGTPPPPPPPPSPPPQPHHQLPTASSAAKQKPAIPHVPLRSSHHKRMAVKAILLARRAALEELRYGYEW